jgi:lipopolysaccharide export system ATP-binding protein
MPVLSATGLTKSYGRRPVVRNVSLEITSGQIVGLFGRNGAGKTTTFEMMTGLVPPDRGTIRLDGEDISRLTTAERARRGLVFLPQEESVFLKTTVEGNLLLVLELMPRPPGGLKEEAARRLGELGLSALARKPAHTLSGGERRRLEICRALVLEPTFLLLDEPFTGIDPLTIRDLQTIFLRLKKRGIGLVLSDHNVRDTLAVADRAVIIDEGQILVSGSPEEVAADERAVERFLGKSFKLDREKGVSPSS